MHVRVQHYKPPDEPPSEYQTIPLSKIEDFGVHCKSYYSLDITYFKSSIDAGLLDLLWAKYWVNTLASSPLLSTRDLTAGQIKDIGRGSSHDAKLCKVQLDAICAFFGGRVGERDGKTSPLIAGKNVLCLQRRSWKHVRVRWCRAAEWHGTRAWVLRTRSSPRPTSSCTRSAATPTSSLWNTSRAAAHRHASFTCCANFLTRSSQHVSPAHG